MGLLQLREELHQFINHADERVLNLLYDIVKADRDGLLTAAQQDDLNKRILRHKNGESKSYCWPVARAMHGGTNSAKTFNFE